MDIFLDTFVFFEESSSQMRFEGNKSDLIRKGTIRKTKTSQNKSRRERFKIYVLKKGKQTVVYAG